MTDHYLPDEVYYRRLDRLKAIAALVDRDRLVEFLGEEAGISPASRLADSGNPQGSPLAAI